MSAEEADGTGLGRPALVLLTGPLAPTVGVRRLTAALERIGPVIVPDLRPHPRRPADLGPPASAVLAAVSAAGAERALLCGVGFGALVALQVAVVERHRVAGLVLSTARPPLAAAARSVHGGVMGLFTAAGLQRISRRSALVALEQVREPDYRGLAAAVRAPALVLHGAADPDNAHAGDRLASALPLGTASRVPDAGPGWVWREPERWVAAAAPFLRGHGLPG